MKIDCTTCVQRDLACSDCVVTLLMALPASDQGLQRAEEQALAVMAESGLVPRLRLLPGVDERDGGGAAEIRRHRASG